MTTVTAATTATTAGRVRTYCVRQWRGLHPLGRDSLIAALALAGTLALGALRAPIGPGAVLLAVSVCVPLAVRRVWPLAAAAVCTAMVLVAAMAMERDLGSLAAFAAIGSAAYFRGHRLLLALASVSWLASIALLGAAGPGAAGPAVALGIGAAPVAFGYALQLKADRAVQLARLERAEELRSRSEERARIAGDVHDVIGHHLSAIRLQALGGRRALAGAEPDADRALGTIAEISADALGEIRELLELLRGRSPELAAPTTGLSGLTDLAARLNGDELEISVAMDERLVATVPAEAQSCAYRVVQESLTNVVRHSDAGRADIVVVLGRVAPDIEDEGLVVTMHDDGPPRAASTGHSGVGGGSGLAGMRDRVVRSGGSFAAGPAGTRGWRVRAVIPLSGGGRP